MCGDGLFDYKEKVSSFEEDKSFKTTIFVEKTKRKVEEKDTGKRQASFSSYETLGFYKPRFL